MCQTLNLKERKGLAGSNMKLIILKEKNPENKRNTKSFGTSLVKLMISKGRKVFCKYYSSFSVHYKHGKDKSML